MENVDKVFYTAGDVVTIKHPLPCKPIMLVKGKETKTIKGAEGSHFLGIRCFWFTFQGEYQENIFSTKDLMHVQIPEQVGQVGVTLEYTSPLVNGIPNVRF